MLTHIPTWMKNSSNWEGGNPRTTFVNQWVKKVAQHYSTNSKVSAFEIWNEPNMLSDNENTVMGLATNAAAYVEMLSAAHAAIKSISPSKKVLNAATTAINQNYPDSLNYNKDMIKFGAESSVDAFAVHYYGKQYERVIGGGGIADFLNSVSHPIWVTESGAQGVNNQLAYVEEVWPFLTDQIPGIDRFYYYQFADASPSDVTYGLRNLSHGLELSDLYISLRDR